MADWHDFLGLGSAKQTVASLPWNAIRSDADAQPVGDPTPPTNISKRRRVHAGIPKEHLDDPQYVQDYSRAHRDAWDIAWSGLRLDDPTQRLSDMAAWAEDIAHKVALDFAELQLSWRS